MTPLEYPRSRRIFRHSSQGSFEMDADHSPAIFPLYEIARGHRKALSQLIITQCVDYLLREARRRVGEQDILSISYMDAFGADRCGDDRYAKRHRLKDL